MNEYHDMSHLHTFPPNLLLHSRAFLRLALVVQSHLCLHASVNCNTLQKKRMNQRGIRFLDADLSSLLKAVGIKSTTFYLPQIF